MNVNIWKRFIWSISNFRNVAELRKEKLTKPIIYLVLLMFFLTVPYTIFIFNDANQGLKKLEQSPLAESITLTYEDNRFSSNLALIEDENIGIVFTEEDIDTNNHDLILYLGRDEGALITSYHSYTFVYNSMFSERETYSVSDVTSGISSFIYTLVFIAAGSFLFVSLIMKFIEVSLLSIAGFFGNKSSNRDLTYGEIWKLSAYAITIPTIVITLMNTFMIQHSFTGVIYWVVSIILLFLIQSHVPKVNSQKK